MFIWITLITSLKTKNFDMETKNLVELVLEFSNGLAEPFFFFLFWANFLRTFSASFGLFLFLFMVIEANPESLSCNMVHFIHSFNFVDTNFSSKWCITEYALLSQTSRAVNPSTGTVFLADLSLFKCRSTRQFIPQFAGGRLEKTEVQ